MHPAPDPSCDLHPSKYRVQHYGQCVSSSRSLLLSSFPNASSELSNAGSWQKRVSSVGIGDFSWNTISEFWVRGTSDKRGGKFPK
jgi:hypothetical protein